MGARSCSTAPGTRRRPGPHQVPHLPYRRPRPNHLQPLRRRPTPNRRPRPPRHRSYHLRPRRHLRLPRHRLLVSHPQQMNRHRRQNRHQPLTHRRCRYLRRGQTHRRSPERHRRLHRRRKCRHSTPPGSARSCYRPIRRRPISSRSGTCHCCHSSRRGSLSRCRSLRHCWKAFHTRLERPARARASSTLPFSRAVHREKPSILH
jgi:hypothetical protein